MKTLKALIMVAVAVQLMGILSARVDGDETKQEFIPAEQQTKLMGGVAHPSVGDLKTMSKEPYILHARGGKLSKVPAEKIILPHDPKGHVQTISVVRAPDGSIYASQMNIMCKSTDGGRTWSSHEWPLAGDSLWQILSDGTFISVGGGAWGKTSDPLPVRVSKDEGRTWQQISEFKLPPQYDMRFLYHMIRLPDNTLMCGIACRDDYSIAFKKNKKNGYKYTYGIQTINAFHSSDDGKTWQGPSKVSDYTSEGGFVNLPSGNLLATVRFARGLLPTDPPDLMNQTGGRGYPYKLVFLVDSNDGGKTWSERRQLTTVFGQCRGYPAALSDGTVVVIHDSRTVLGVPGAPGSRAMVSHDEGKTWEDEVYYLDYSTWGGSYNASVVLEDDLILTIDGTTDRGGSWAAAVGHCDMTAIRWRLADRND